MNSPHILLELTDVVKSFGGLKAANRVSLQIEKGEIRGIIGPNGSGKTTLINLISGLYRPSGGAIYLEGLRLDGLQPNAIAHLGIMRTFQISRVFRDMTVLENMMVPALAQGDAMGEARRRAEELLDFALLRPLKHEPTRVLSGGQVMLLQIVRGLMNTNLRLYLMDEPFAGVHASIKDLILKAIHSMNKEKGITFLIVSHEMATIRSLCEQVSVLHEGQVICQGTMSEVANDPLVIDSYLGG
jgi:branched-chain amino acid transport system ATP-binding protein